MRRWRTWRAVVWSRTRAVTLVGLGVAQSACGGPAVRPAVRSTEVPATPTTSPSASEAVRASPCSAGMVLVSGARLSITRDEATSELDVATFCLDRTEVSAAAYEPCVQAGACTAAWLTETVLGDQRPSDVCSSGREDRREHPIQCVDFDQASAFCRWRGARLPTGVEWELAARGSDGRPFPWGAAAPDETRVWASLDGADRAGPTLADSLPGGASADGVLHLADNVSEWTDEVVASVLVLPAPEVPARPMRAVHGGSFESRDAARLAGDARLAMHEDERAGFVGFRCARAPEPEGEAGIR
jgi:formylglycine-generating enzyme required for sulfatase activity